MKMKKKREVLCCISVLLNILENFNKAIPWGRAEISRKISSMK